MALLRLTILRDWVVELFLLEKVVEKVLIENLKSWVSSFVRLRWGWIFSKLVGLGGFRNPDTQVDHGPLVAPGEPRLALNR